MSETSLEGAWRWHLLLRHHGDWIADREDSLWEQTAGMFVLSKALKPPGATPVATGQLPVRNNLIYSAVYHFRGADGKIISLSGVIESRALIARRILRLGHRPDRHECHATSDFISFSHHTRAVSITSISHQEYSSPIIMTTGEVREGLRLGAWHLWHPLETWGLETAFVCVR